MRLNIAITTVAWVIFLICSSLLTYFEVQEIFLMSIGNDTYSVYEFLIAGNTLAAVGIYRKLHSDVVPIFKKIFYAFYYIFIGQIYSFMILMALVILSSDF